MENILFFWGIWPELTQIMVYPKHNMICQVWKLGDKQNSILSLLWSGYNGSVDSHHHCLRGERVFGLSSI
jgi:hypothetical protein